MRADHPRTLTASPAMRAAAAAQKLGIKALPPANPPTRPESPVPAPAAANSPLNTTAASRRDVRNALVLRLRRLAPQLFAGRHYHLSGEPNIQICILPR